MTNKLQEVIQRAQETGNFQDDDELIQFSEGLTLENIVYEWWKEEEYKDKITAVSNLLHRIRKWLPEYQTDEGENERLNGLNQAFRLIHSKIKNH